MVCAACWVDAGQAEGAAEPVRQFGSEAKVQQIVPFHSLKDYDVRDELILVMPSVEQWGAFSVHIHHRAFPLRGMSCQHSSLEREWCLNATSHILKGSFTDNSFMGESKNMGKTSKTVEHPPDSSLPCLFAIPGEGSDLGCGTDWRATGVKNSPSTVQDSKDSNVNLKTWIVVVTLRYCIIKYKHSLFFFFLVLEVI